MKKRHSVAIVIPVYYKEAPTLARRLGEQIRFYRKALRHYDWTIIVANNGPRKDVLPVVRSLMRKHKHLTYTDIDIPGRGIALRHTWLSCKQDLLAYMDADLATSLHSFPKMLSLLSEQCDIVIGSRYVQGANIKRTFIRLILSKFYNFLLNTILGLHITDSQCGFKGIRREVAQEVIPSVKDQEWFFDTEMLFVAKEKKYSICEIPVEWYEQEETSVKLISVSLNYIKNILRLRFSSFFYFLQPQSS